MTQDVLKHREAIAIPPGGDAEWMINYIRLYVRDAISSKKNDKTQLNFALRDPPFDEKGNLFIGFELFETEIPIVDLWPSFETKLREFLK